MLELIVPIEPEKWDEKTESFIEPKCVVLNLEHSLVSLSKWESRWCKPFLSQRKQTAEEVLDYIKCMTITSDVDPNVYNHLTEENILKVKEYIAAPMTATRVSEDKNAKRSREILTAELIYYSMISLQIPFECQDWHLNRLITLIKVCNRKNAPPKKTNKRDLMRQNAELNAARRKQLNTRG